MGITQETRREGYNRALSAITPRQALIISALRTGPNSGINNAVYELKREAGECCTQ